MHLDLQLLLAHADDRLPVLASGLSLNPDTVQGLSEGSWKHKAFRAVFEDPNSLLAQRWGIVAPKRDLGDRLLALVEPLRRARQEEQGGFPPKVYRVPPDMNLLQAIRWKEQVYRDEAVPEQERPGYLLFLGDLDQVSIHLQQVMASDTFVGRLAFPNDEGFEAYVAKVLRWERAPAGEAMAQTLFYVARDGSAATTHGDMRLIKPSVALCRQGQAAGFFPAREIAEVEEGAAGSIDSLLESAAAAEASLLLTLSHGLGPPRAGWRSPREQQLLQGALVGGPGEQLVAQDLAERPFLPGGMWLYYACFSAGTPSRSAYHHWLHRLKSEGTYGDALAPVLAGLSPQPFVAALPQAALANPRGPLAVIGHIDLAWTSSYQDPEGRNRSSRFTGLLRGLANRCRAGLGLYALTRFAAEMDVSLAHLLDLEEEARVAREVRPPEPMHRAHLWMVRQDLAGFVLLGDPAVRLPLGLAKAKQDPAPVLRQPVKALTEPLAADEGSREEAVLALLMGEAAARDIATRYGVSLGTLRKWEAVYREAGRAALKQWGSQAHSSSGGGIR
jgi:hypothetical protein